MDKYNESRVNDSLQFRIPQPVHEWLSSAHKVKAADGTSLKPDKLAYVVSVVTRGYELKTFVEDAGIRLHSKLLERVLAREWRTYMDTLIEMGVIKTNGSYEVGKRSRSYELGEGWIGPLRVYRAKDRALVKQLRKHHPHYQLTVDRNVEIVRAQFDRVRFDSLGARKALDQSYLSGEMYRAFEAKHGFRLTPCELESLTDGQYRVTGFKFDNMAAGDWMIDRSSTNWRVHHEVANLKSEYRRFLSFDEFDAVVNVDVVNCQPFLLSLLLGCSSLIENILSSVSSVSICSSLPYVMSFSETQANEEITQFSTLTRQGRFYDWFTERVKERTGMDMTRDEAKEATYQVLFSSNQYRTLEKSVFKSALPAVYAFCEGVKETEHNRLAIALQRLEAWVFIDHVAPVLAQLGTLFITIHDSVLVPAEYAPQAVNVITGVFRTLFNETPTLKVEAVN